MTGRIARRLLVNYRVDPDALAPLLPAPFRPALVDGHAIAGICLIRLEELRPDGLPAAMGQASENAAHRIAVEWDGPDGPRTGVYIPLRDTASPVVHMAGGRLFPGVHRRSRFAATSSADGVSVTVSDRDGDRVRVAVEGRAAPELPSGSVFGTLDRASAFFARGAVGWSATRRPGVLDGLELACTPWRVEPLETSAVRSEIFDDRARFPDGSATFDCTLLMRDVACTWQALPRDEIRSHAPAQPKRRSASRATAA